MPTLQHIGEMTARMGDLHALFVFGERLMPALEELLLFMGEVTPLLNEVSASLQESSGKMPRVSTHLRNVSEATELATNEILDYIDVVLARLELIRASAGRSISEGASLRLLQARLSELLQSELGASHPGLLDRVAAITAEHEAVLDALDRNARRQAEAVSEAHGKVSGIMVSLQVQDITAQQLAAVHHLVDSMGRRLDVLFRRLGGDPAAPESAPEPHPGEHYDPRAAYDRSGAQQQVADALFAARPSPPPASRADAGSLPSGFAEGGA